MEGINPNKRDAPQDKLPGQDPTKRHHPERDDAPRLDVNLLPSTAPKKDLGPPRILNSALRDVISEETIDVPPEREALSAPISNEDILAKYDKLQVEYTTFGFTANSETLIKNILADDGVPPDYKSKLALYKIVRFVAKTFLLNEMEILMFGHYMRKVGWKYSDELSMFEKNIKFDANVANFAQEFIRVNLHLLCVGYHIKKIMNDHNEVGLLRSYLNLKVVSSFESLFSAWQRSKNLSFNQNDLIPLNKLFTRYHARGIEQDEKKITDFNQLVDKILEMSQPYATTDKGNDKHKNLSPRESVAQSATGKMINSARSPSLVPNNNSQVSLPPKVDSTYRIPSTFLPDIRFEGGSYQPGGFKGEIPLIGQDSVFGGMGVKKDSFPGFSSFYNDSMMPRQQSDIKEAEKAVGIQRAESNRSFVPYQRAPSELDFGAIGGIGNISGVGSLPPVGSSGVGVNSLPFSGGGVPAGDKALIEKTLGLTQSKGNEEFSQMIQGGEIPNVPSLPSLMSLSKRESISKYLN